MADLQNKKLIVLKGVLFSLILGIALGTIVVLTQDWLIAGLLGLVVWSAARLYYFVFYVLERYVDPRLKYAGLSALIMAIVKRPDSGNRESDP